MQLSGIEPSPLSSIDIMFSIEQEFIPIQTILQDCFSRVETKVSAMSYFQGLISTIERKNSWQLAEQAGCESPYAFQYLLGRATWDVSRLRDSVSRYTVDFMSEEEGVLSLDKTGFLKKGNKSAGVGRQYTGISKTQKRLRSTLHLHRTVSHSKIWLKLQEVAGLLRSALKWLKVKWGWTNMKYAVGLVGIAILLLQCLRLLFSQNYDGILNKMKHHCLKKKYKTIPCFAFSKAEDWLDSLDSTGNKKVRRLFLYQDQTRYRKTF